VEFGRDGGERRNAEEDRGVPKMTTPQLGSYDVGSYNLALGF